MTLPRAYQILNQSFIIFRKCQYLEMVHYFTMVEENGTGNAYKKMKTLKSLIIEKFNKSNSP